MGRIEQLAEKYKQHIGLPWQQTVAGAQRVIMIVYDKEMERSLMARKEAFAMAALETGNASALSRTKVIALSVTA